MRINHNGSAVNAYRSNTETMRRIGKSTEKLSSGLRINRAGDDSAGLAISEKMRGQINGLEKSTKNSQDAISLIQTAEGSLNETHSILQRMRELAVQSSNDTNTNSDRQHLQKEVDRLRQEVDRIAATTEFNQKRLLTGEYAKDGLTFQVGANEGQVVNLKFNDMGAKALGIAGVEERDYSGEINKKTKITKKSRQQKKSDDLLLDLNISSGGKSHNLKVDKNYEIETSSKNKKTQKGVVDLQAKSRGKKHSASIKKSGELSYSEERIKKRNRESTELNSETIVSRSKTRYTRETGVDITTAKKAEKAITTVDHAIEKVSDERSRFGAMQNRLEHTIMNLSLFKENLSASESRIRDANLAKEIVNNSKDRIISQSGNSMLVQANAQPQKVLQLLG